MVFCENLCFSQLLYLPEMDYAQRLLAVSLVNHSRVKITKWSRNLLTSRYREEGRRQRIKSIVPWLLSDVREKHNKIHKELQPLLQLTNFTTQSTSFNPQIIPRTFSRCNVLSCYSFSVSISVSSFKSKVNKLDFISIFF